MERHEKIELHLSPNEFEDNDDWLGIMDTDIPAQEFLTIEKYTRSTEPMTDKHYLNVKFPISQTSMPTTQLYFELSDLRFIYARTKYSLFTLLGDFGGF